APRRHRRLPEAEGCLAISQAGARSRSKAHGELEPPPMRSTSATMRPCPQEPAPAEETLEDRQVVHRPSASFRRPLGASRGRVPLRRTASDRKTPFSERATSRSGTSLSNRGAAGRAALGGLPDERGGPFANQ